MGTVKGKVFDTKNLKNKCCCEFIGTGAPAPSGVQINLRFWCWLLITRPKHLSLVLLISVHWGTLTVKRGSWWSAITWAWFWWSLIPFPVIMAHTLKSCCLWMYSLDLLPQLCVKNGNFCPEVCQGSLTSWIEFFINKFCHELAAPRHLNLLA